ncbi:TPA: hypothetical protein ACPZS8_003738 [Yersinia enterocolitica]
MKINLLIVEDEQAIISQWQEKLEFYGISASPVYNISATYTDDLEKSLDKLLNYRFDAVVIDIRLKAKLGEIPNQHGNEIAKIVSNSTLAVMAICTAEPSTVDLTEEQKFLVKTFQKGQGDAVLQILEWLDSKKKMLEAVQKMQQEINEQMAKLFSRSVWPRWEYWLQNDVPDSLTQSALKRHMATHLHASFLNESEKAHPEEYYFIPPLKNQLDTGDILIIDSEYYILVTPRCDLAREENKTFQLVYLSCIKERWDIQQGIINTPLSVKKKDAADREIRRIINHDDRSAKSHFLPQIKLSANNYLGPFHAKFDHMYNIKSTSEKRSELLENRIATLSNEFLPSLVERLGTYFSRIGTPDYSHPE